MSRAIPEPDPDMNGRVGIAILARAPIPGAAKTRLIPALGGGGAASLQGWLLRRAVALAVVADVGPVALWCTGDAGHPDFAECRAYGPVALHAQPAGDLGARMLAAMRQSPTPGGTLLIGTDCPALTPSHVQQAAQALRDHHAVVIPAEDGGYVLIGMKAPAPQVFAGIDWGSPQVMAQTRERLAALGWHWLEPRTLWDVDRPEDLQRLYTACPDARQASLLEAT